MMSIYGKPLTEEEAKRVMRLSREHRARQIKALYESARAELEGGVLYGYPIDVDNPIEVAAALRCLVTHWELQHKFRDTSGEGDLR